MKSLSAIIFLILVGKSLGQPQQGFNPRPKTNRNDSANTQHNYDSSINYLSSRIDSIAKNNESDAQKNHYYDTANLNAARKMADANKDVVNPTWLGSVFGGVALILSLITFLGARRQSRRELRAYISTKLAGKKWFTEEPAKDGTGVLVYFHPVFVNHGKTHAEEVKWSWYTFTHREGEEISKRPGGLPLYRLHHLQNDPVFGAGENVPGKAVYIVPMQDWPIITGFKTPINICLCGRLVYRDIFGYLWERKFAWEIHMLHTGTTTPFNYKAKSHNGEKCIETPLGAFFKRPFLPVKS